MEKLQVKLGLVGYGEICSALAAGLRGQGLADVVCFDVGAIEGPYRDLIRGRAREAGVELVYSVQDLASKASLIVSATPGSASLSSATKLASHLDERHVLVDIASATPKVKRMVQGALQSNGSLFADGSILGTPRDGHKMQILASGPGAARFRDMMTPWGMMIDVVSDRVGDASGIKILRSIVTKGLEALLFECMLGARRYGIADIVLNSLHKQMSRPIRDLANGMLSTGVIHARRRSEEAAMAADALREVGIDSIMMGATAARLRWVADLGVKERFGGIAPKTYEEAVAAIEALCGYAIENEKVDARTN